jgi:hypothetical protein
MKQGNKLFLIAMLILAIMWLGYFLQWPSLLSASCVKRQNTPPKSAALSPAPPATNNASAAHQLGC